MTDIRRVPSDVGLIILAAGASTRLGRAKQLLVYQGRSLLRHTAETALASVCRPIVVVLGAQAAQFAPELTGLPVHILENPNWALGIGSSIQAGLNAREMESAQAVVITLCDQPLLSPQIINSLVETHRDSQSPVVASEYGGTLGVPALFHRSLFLELADLDPAEGAKKVILRHLDQTARLSFPSGTVDIDTEADYQRLHELP